MQPEPDRTTPDPRHRPEATPRRPPAGALPAYDESVDPVCTAAFVDFCCREEDTRCRQR